MSKKAVEIKPECIENLKTILSEQKMSQKDLHDMTGISQNTISMIMHKKTGLSQSVASQICECVPGCYRVQWLLGLDDDKTDFESQLHPVLNHLIKKNRDEKAIEQLLYNLGLNVDLEDIDGCDMPANEFFELDDSEQEEIIHQVYDHGFYEIIKDSNQDGKQIGRIPREEYTSFIEDISDYALFKIERLCEKYSNKSINI